MNLTALRDPDAEILKLFSQQDDFMQDFLGQDRGIYTRYGAHEQLEMIWRLDVQGSPAGCIAYRQRTEGVGEIKRLFILPQHRDRGLSKLLLAAAEDYARTRGCHTLFLDTRITL